jgi:hypothetical protein
MSNLRIIYDNAVDVASSISASSTAAGFDIGNVRNDYKGKVHRSVGTSVTYTISWNGVNAEAIGAVVLPATNLSTDATIKVDMYSGVSGTGTLVYTSGTIYACPGLNIEDWDWNSPLNWNDNTNVNMFTFGKISKTAVWLVESNQFFSQKVCRSITITLNDPNNPVGYIDCARIIAGAFWEPTFNVDKNSLNITNVDTSTTSRANSGDLLFDRGAC